MHQTPRYSIVIPTRNRAAVLASALRTCVEVEHPDFEVVVSDNDSDDETAATVAAFGDSRVRYVKTPTFVTMGANFENGLRHARGSFLIFIGDDDGVMPFCLRALDFAFERYPDVDYVGWHLTGLFWPQPRETTQRVNWLSDLHGPELETPQQAWRRMAKPRSTEAAELGGFNLYHGCIRRTATDAAQAAGVRLFESPIPDIASGIRILPYVRHKLRLELPLTVHGLSSTSNSRSGRAVQSNTQDEMQSRVHRQFNTMNAVAYPESALVRYLNTRWNRALAYLGPLIDEHMARKGHLAELDTDVWRLIFIESIFGTAYESISGHTDDFNEIADWMHERGATGGLKLSPTDIIAYKNSVDRLPKNFGKPFRFSNASVATDGQTSLPKPFYNGEGRILSMYQDDTAINLDVRAEGEEFTVHDYVRVMAALIQSAHEDPARVLVEDPAIFRAQLLLDVFHRVAQGERARAS